MILLSIPLYPCPLMTTKVGSGGPLHMDTSICKGERIQARSFTHQGQIREGTIVRRSCKHKASQIFQVASESFQVWGEKDKKQLARPSHAEGWI